MSPVFWGPEPAHRPAGVSLRAAYQDLSVLETERKQARGLIDSLSAAQQDKSGLTGQLAIAAGAGKDDIRLLLPVVSSPMR